jgi:uncharacterized protein (UPF0332 family)
MTAASDLLKDAEKLAAVAPGQRDDARRRSILSRAYYAAYHQARSRFGAEPAGRGAGGMHRRFLTWLAASDDETGQRVGRILDRLYRSRLHADYDLARPIQPGGELHALGEARRIAAATAPEKRG